MERKDYFQKEVGLGSQPISFPLTIDFVKSSWKEEGVVRPFNSESLNSCSQ